MIQAQGMSEMTGGAFDVTVKPVVDLYQQSRPGLPEDDEIRSALNLVDYRKLTVSAGEIALGQPGMAVTLDGIAKGYIVDAGSAVLKRMGFENVLVEAGGDLMAGGNKDGDAPWKIGVQSPQGSLSDLLTQIKVSNQAAATSGDYFQFFSEDRMNHHIIDPRSGFSSPELASATILSERAVKSDALATAVMVLGKAGLDLIESISGSEALLVTKEGAMLKSSGFPES
jgi:thiamine biosynthesis lipoprotein